MFEKLFAKYARAVNDGREREYLFKKFKVKTVVSFVFYALCAAIIILALVLSESIEQDWALILFTVVIFAWIGFAIASLCLWISFKKTYNEILKRPAAPNEMPEITAYRQKSVQEKKSSFKKLWWAWLALAVSIAAFFVCIIMETIKNPDSEEFGVWGGVGCAILCVGVLTIAFAYVINSAVRQQKGNTFEQQTESEARAIDKAQGRKHAYKLEADKNLQSYKYLFPNRELYEKAEEIRKKNVEINKYALIALVLIIIPAIILFLCSEKLGQDVSGYAFPAVFTFIYAWVILFALPLNRKLVALENMQKKELEANPEYAKNLEWYKLYKDFSKFKGKVIVIFVILSIALGWVLAVLFPTAPWSLLSIIPSFIGLFIHNLLIKDLRKKAIPIEAEIDKKELALDKKSEELDRERNDLAQKRGDSLMCKGNESGEITLYLEDKYICMEIDGKTGRVLNFSSMVMFLSDIPKGEISPPENAIDGALYAEIFSVFGFCWRINFAGAEQYDEKSKIYLVGERDEALPWYRIFKNAYVQLDEENRLRCVLFTEISAEEE